MPPANEHQLRQLPSVTVLLEEAARAAWAEGLPRSVLVDALREAVEEARQRLCGTPTLPLTLPSPSGRGARGEGRENTAEALREAILRRAQERARDAAGPHFRKVINATGIILHTGLGRAVLPEKALRQMQEHLAGYSLLQVDVATGKRSRRDARIEWLLRRLTGAEAATLVNNNAAATFIVLHVLAKGREVIVSRGQLVEIGGSFRLPEVMAASGARLVEVGTTNKTHPRDYELAITENTAAILRVHPSNYKIVGFTAEVPLEVLVRIAHDHHLPLIDDVGAGALIDLARFGFAAEPTLPGSIRAGADVVIASADKLIGGSQGGLILGRAAHIQAIRKDPFARILRPGKLTLAALEATLTLFLDEATALSEVPTFRMLRREPADLSAQAERIAERLRQGGVAAAVTTAAGASQMGSGSLPAQDLPTRLVLIRPERVSPDALAERLRRHEPPVFTRIQDEQVWIDPRTLLRGEEEVLVEALVRALAAAKSGV